MKESKAAQALAYLRKLAGIELAETAEIQLQDYEAKDGTKISTDADGKVQGEVKDGEYELADGSTLVVKDGVASVKEAEKPAAADAAKQAEKAADAPAADSADAGADDAEAQADDALKQSIDALTQAIQQLMTGMGLKEQELKATKTELAETKQKLEEADKKPLDKKQAVGQGLTNLADEAKLTKGQKALAKARALRG